jgi:excisionase family DNA binding protein
MQSNSQNSTHNIPKLYTPREAAALLKISMAGVYRLVDARVIPFYHVGRGLRFAEEDLIKYLSGNRTEPITRDTI